MGQGWFQEGGLVTEGKRAQVSLHSIHTNVRKLFAALYMLLPAYYIECVPSCAREPLAKNCLPNSAGASQTNQSKEWPK